MLASLSSVLRQAQRRHYAVGSFNTSNLELTQAILSAAETLQAPVIISTTEKAVAYAGIEVLAIMVQTLARRASVPVVLNLDHGHSLATVKAAIRTGYTGIMFDGSRLPYEQNRRQTRQAVALCARAGIPLEAELGTVGGRQDVIRQTLQLTDPWQAQAFVRQTKCAALAVGIGSAHGLPVPGERLDFDRLREIRERVSVPLVLHGASSTPPARVRRAIKLGITKLNIDTDLRVAFTDGLREFLGRHRRDYDPRDSLTVAREQVRRVVMQKIRLFGSAGRA